ncbi:hypothetical protein MIND_00723200 [Mycena indigotica]|uniref:Uncharacterized protein n=1 Tax=Mycena indigotica TaxID=2126181 RepID=A0A8H6W1I2_9AGAR|nr:uncharacterized protein MIND_00723200 [Mycena indigotica]KAF7301577.1 hypothetical protein MIND_00723200 [Mycena indigotica]
MGSSSIPPSKHIPQGKLSTMRDTVYPHAQSIHKGNPIYGPIPNTAAEPRQLLPMGNVAPPIPTANIASTAPNKEHRLPTPTGYAKRKVITQYERDHYYHGISDSPPPLLWRSDLEENLFPTPAPGERFFSIPVKTAHDASGTPLAPVWPIVAPMILAVLKARGIKYSSMMPVRFLIEQDGKDAYIGPIVIWIAVPPNSSSAAIVCDATPDILGILADKQVTGVVVEWYIGEVKRLVDPR